MGGSSDQESTTSGWQPAMDAGQNIINQAGSIYDQMMGSSVPTLDNIGMNANLQQAWDKMGGSGMDDLAGFLGTAGAGMMGGMSQLPGLYEEIGKGPSLYNQQSMRDTLLADKQAVLDEQNAASMAQLNKAMAQSTGSIYGQAAGGGNVGSSRTQLASGQASGNLAAQQAATMANLTSQAYDTASNQAMANEQARLSALGQQAAGIMGMGQMGSSMVGAAGNVYQQGINNQLQAGTGQMAFDQQNNMINYMNAQSQYNQPLQLLGWYNQQVSPWVNAQQTSTTSGGSSGLGSAIGAIGGAALGSMVGMPTLGAQLGGGLGGAIG